MPATFVRLRTASRRATGAAWSQPPIRGPKHRNYQRTRPPGVCIRTRTSPGLQAHFNFVSYTQEFFDLTQDERDAFKATLPVASGPLGPTELTGAVTGKGTAATRVAELALNEHVPTRMSAIDYFDDVEDLPNDAARQRYNELMGSTTSRAV